MYGETIFLNQVQNQKFDKRGNETQEKAYDVIGDLFFLACGSNLFKNLKFNVQNIIVYYFQTMRLKAS